MHKIIITLLLMFLPLMGETINIFGNFAKPPKVYLENGEPKGILVDIMNAVEQKSDFQFHIELHPWARAFEMAKSGDGGIIGLSKTPERQQFMDYSDVMFDDELILVVKKGEAFDYKGIESLKGKRIGVSRGAVYGAEFENAKSENLFSIDEDNVPSSRFKKLLLGRIDVAIVGPGNAGFYAVISKDAYLSKQINQFTILQKPFKSDPNYLGFAKSQKMGGFLTRFNQILSALKESGELEAIIHKD